MLRRLRWAGSGVTFQGLRLAELEGRVGKTEGPDISGLRRPATESMESRMTSASRRWRGEWWRRGEGADIGGLRRPATGSMEWRMTWAWGGGGGRWWRRLLAGWMCEGFRVRGSGFRRMGWGSGAVGEWGEGVLDCW